MFESEQEERGGESAQAESEQEERGGESAQAERKQHTFGRYSNEEDALLKKLVIEHGEDWVKIFTLFSGRFPRRSALSIEKRFQRLESSMYTSYREEWTEEEDRWLIQELNTHGAKWSTISAKLPHRSMESVKSHGYKLLNWKKSSEKVGEAHDSSYDGDPVHNPLLDVHRKRRQAWTEEEDNLLIQELTEHGLNWRKIIPLFPHRSRRSVSDHVQVLLDRNQSLKALDLKRSKSDRRSELKRAAKEREETALITTIFSAQEDTPLVQEKHVAKESEETAYTRTQWSAEEDKILIHAVNQHVYKIDGECDNWDAVAAIIQERFPRRTPRACRHRWLRMSGSGPAGSKLSMHTKWTEQEDNRLINEQKEHGCRWTYMLDKFPNRTYDALQCRWTYISKGGERKHQRAANNKTPDPSKDVVEDAVVANYPPNLCFEQDQPEGHGDKADWTEMDGRGVLDTFDTQPICSTSVHLETVHLETACPETVHLETVLDALPPIRGSNAIEGTEGIFLTDYSIGLPQFEALGGMDMHGIPADAFLGDLDIQPTESSLLSVSLDDDRCAEIDLPGVEDYGILCPD